VKYRAISSSDENLTILHIITFVMQGMFTEKGRMQMKDAQQANNNEI
jgi:hypothetical protein